MINSDFVAQAISLWDLLEAMKMENEIKAQQDGVIKKVSVEVMSSVEKNEMLFEYR